MRRTILAIFLLAILPIQRAQADGMMAPRIIKVGQSDALVSSPKQEAILLKEGDTVRVILRTHFNRGPEELAWIIPIPAKPENISVGDDAIFTQLDDATAPRFLMMGPPSGFAFGCGMAQRSETVIESTVVEAVGKAGVFDYAVLSAKDPADLQNWLHTNGYAVPAGSAEVFDHYIQGGYHFLAVRLSAKPSAEPTLAPQPICYSYKADALVYPMIISKLSAAPENEIVLYIAAEQRYACANWNNGAYGFYERTAPYDFHPIDTFEYSPDSPSHTSYEDTFRRGSQRIGHFFVAEYSMPMSNLEGTAIPHNFEEMLAAHDDPHVATVTRVGALRLTRLRALLRPEEMDRDVMLIPVATWGDVYRNHSVDMPQKSSLSLAAFLLPAAALAVLRRKRAGRWGLALLLALGAIGLLLM